MLYRITSVPIVVPNHATASALVSTHAWLPSPRFYTALAYVSKPFSTSVSDLVMFPPPIDRLNHPPHLSRVGVARIAMFRDLKKKGRLHTSGVEHGTPRLVLCLSPHYTSCQPSQRPKSGGFRYPRPKPSHPQWPILHEQGPCSDGHACAACHRAVGSIWAWRHRDWRRDRHERSHDSTWRCMHVQHVMRRRTIACSMPTIALHWICRSRRRNLAKNRS